MISDFHRHGHNQTVAQRTGAMPRDLCGSGTVVAGGADPDVIRGLSDWFSGGNTSRKTGSTLRTGGGAKSKNIKW